MEKMILVASLALSLSTAAMSAEGGRPTGEPGLVEMAEKTFENLERSRLVTPEDAAGMQRVYLEAHVFAKAKALAEKYPGAGLEYIPAAIIEPPVILENTGKYYETAPDGESVSLKSMDISSGNFILVYADPGDPLAARAMGKIEADDTLGPAFAAWASLLTDKYNFKKSGEWNAKHRVKFKIMYSEKEWAGLEKSSVPVFNVFKDGKPACFVGGWKDEASALELNKCLAEAGFLSREGRLAAALRIIELRMVDVPGYNERVSLFKKEYGKLAEEGAFDTAALGAYSRQALLDAYETTGYYVAYSPAKDKLESLENIFAEIEKRKMEDAGKVKTLYGLLLDARKFDTAGLLRARYAGYELENPPKLSGKEPARGKIFVYKVTARNVLATEAAGLKGKQIIIAAQPGFHPTQRAFKEIEADKVLSDIFKNKGLLLAAGSDFAGVNEWNGSHKVKFKLINSARDWPGIDLENSPSFYFLEDGKIVYSFTGWPQDGNMAELHTGLRRLGLNKD